MVGEDRFLKIIFKAAIPKTKPPISTPKTLFPSKVQLHTIQLWNLQSDAIIIFTEYHSECGVHLLLRYMASYSAPPGNGFRNRNKIGIGIGTGRVLRGLCPGAISGNQAFVGDGRARDPLW